MPEGPEVKRSADYLSKLLVGQRLRSVGVHTHGGGGGRYAKAPPEGMAELLAVLKDTSLPIEEVSCKGKFMYWTFRPGWTMWCTYGMSGQWTTQKPDKHTALTMWTDRSDGTGLLAINFRDPRHFGTVKFLHEPGGELTQAKLDSLGPDMLGDPPDERQFRVALNRRNQKTLAEVMMDQGVISGVGNYIKAEALYLAELSPHRVVCDLSSIEIERLRTQIINVMKASYNTGGATISTYRNVDGTKGGAQRRFAVYGNQTDPIGNSVVKEETKDGRTTHWVPAIQK